MASAPRLLLVLPAMALAVWMAVAGARWVFLDLTYAATEAELSFWGREAYRPTPGTVSQTGQRLDVLLGHSPANPNYLALQAYFWSWQGFFSENTGQRLAFNQQAVDAQYAALLARPAYRQGWAEMVEYASRTAGGAEMLELAQSRIAALQPERQEAKHQ